MALVNVTNVVVLDNPTLFTNPFQFEITFECLEDLKEDLEWKVIYVGSSESSDGDVVLDEVMVGPLNRGCHKFVLQSEAPLPEQLQETALGITVVLIVCSYRTQEFVRIGYYVNNELPEGMAVEEDPQQQQQSLHLDQIVRTTLADKPRVTRFHIEWDDGDVVVQDYAQSDTEMAITAPAAAALVTPTHGDAIMMET